MKKLLLFSLILTSFQVFSQTKFVEIKNVDYEQIYVQGFTLDAAQDISVKAVGLSNNRYMYNQISSAAWILNSATRDVVWELDDASEKEIDHDLTESTDKINLPKGTYELYFAQYPSYNFSFSRGKYEAISAGRFLGNLFGSIFNDRRRDYDYRYDWDDNNSRWENSSYYRKLKDKLEVSISGNGKVVGESVIEGLQTAFRKNAFIEFDAAKDNGHFEQGFTLSKSTEVDIYSFGEINRNENYDFGWIQNTLTNEKVWELDYRHSEYGGGADKNRYARTTLTLPAGNYVAFYSTDDSHSPNEWNSAPPFDPNFWGLLVKAKSEADKNLVKTFDYHTEVDKNTIVNLTKARDSDYLSKGFTLSKPMTVRIHAVGEGSGNDMYDYGWIVNAKTRETIWKMKYRDTENAGGASKNRMVDEVLQLEKGNYIAYFVTDDSHSYRDWNAGQPANPEDWGIRISIADSKASKSDVTEFEETKSANSLAQIVRVRNHAHKSAAFKLDKATKVRIYAIGEGVNHDMADYGWIENAKNDDIVWEMTYRKTENAGGARKNRLVNTTITLEAGEYTVHYETDDSHAFNDWNDDPPYDPTSWGITVSAEE